MEIISQVSYHLLFLISALMNANNAALSEVVIFQNTQIEAVCYLRAEEGNFLIYQDKLMQKTIGSILKQGENYDVTFGLKSAQYPVADFSSLVTQGKMEFDGALLEVSSKADYIYLKPLDGDLSFLIKKHQGS